MPQPAEVHALADPTVQAYADAWTRIQAEQERLGADPLRLSRQRHLRAMSERIFESMDELDHEVATEYIANVLPQAYLAGAESGASLVNSQFVWDQINQQAVQTLAQSAWNDLLHATQHVRDSTKDLVRRVAKSESLQAAIAGNNPKLAGKLMREILEANGIHAIKYADGSLHGLAEYAEMVQRTKMATGYNIGTLNASKSEWYEVFDGPDCGLSFHYDPTLANGLIIRREDCFKYVIAHPNCRRSFGPRPDIAGPKEALSAEKSTLPEQERAQRLADAERRAAQERAARRRTARGSNRLEQRQARQQARAEKVGPTEQVGSPVRIAELTPEELEAVRAYTGADFAGINNILRRNVDLNDPDVALYSQRIQRIDSAMAKSTLDEDTQVFRGMTLSKYQDAEHRAMMDQWFESPGVLRKDLLGKEVTDPAYTSTALKEEKARKFIRASDGSKVDVGDRSFLMDIKLGKGTHAIDFDLEGISVQGETEMLVARGTKFKITAIEDPKFVRGKWEPGRITMETVDFPVGAGGRTAELEKQIAELEAKLKTAPGGGARARIKAKLEPLRKELDDLKKADDPFAKVDALPSSAPLKEQGVPLTGVYDKDIRGVFRTSLDEIKAVESTRIPDGAKFVDREFQITDLTPVQPVVKGEQVKLALRGELSESTPLVRMVDGKPVLVDGTHRTIAAAMRGEKTIKVRVVDEAKPVIKKFGDFRDDLPDFSTLPTLDEIKKAHFGWTNKSAEKELIRLKLEKLPTVPELRKAHPGWTTKVAEKRLEELKAHVTGGKPVIKPPPVKPEPKPKLPPEIKKTAPTPKADSFKSGPVESRIKAVQAKYEKELGGIDDETVTLGNFKNRQLLETYGREDPEFAARHPELFTKSGPSYRANEGSHLTMADVRKGLKDFRPGEKVWEDYVDSELMPQIKPVQGSGSLSTKQIHAFLAKGNTPMSDAAYQRIFGRVLNGAERLGFGNSPRNAALWYRQVMDARVAGQWTAGRGVGIKRLAGRAHYEQNPNVIALDTSDQTRVAVHELGHAFENNINRTIKGDQNLYSPPVSDTQRMSREFLNYRSAGERQTEIYRGSGEMGYKDKFISHYMGKVYNQDTEIISMGFEEMYANPVRLLQKDPEYFWFMVGLLKGDLV